MVGINSLSKLVIFFACLMSEDKRNIGTSLSINKMLKFIIPSSNNALEIVSRTFQ